jgi:hypothetical protein
MFYVLNDAQSINLSFFPPNNRSCPRLLGVIDTGGIFADRLLSAILGLPAINLLKSFLASLEAEPGVFTIRN